jgi:hypothetical protein
MFYTIEFADSVITDDIPSIPMPYKEQIKKAIRERLSKVIFAEKASFFNHYYFDLLT